MNKKMIRYILGWVMLILAAFMSTSCVVALIYHESEGLWFLFVSLFCCVIGLLMCFKKPGDTVFYLKEGCIATGLSWVIMSLFGCLPFYLCGAIPSFTDALFETISGFTTTGASILPDVDALPRCCLFWRSFTHWIGGMGVLMFLLSIVSMTGGSHMNLMRAESPGPSVGKLVPKVKHTARILYLIYIGLTVLQIIFLLAGRMPVFDAITISFGTAGTGGFSVRSSGMADYSPYLQWVITVFMIIFGVNFNAYYFILMRKWKQALGIEEVRWYLAIILVAIAIITYNAYSSVLSFWENLRHASFQVASIITTTGFATTDFDLWPSASKTILVMLMFIGACAGSTGGGIKVSRVTTGVKAVANYLQSYIHPKSVKRVKVDGHFADGSFISGVLVYFITFILVFVMSVFIVSLDGNDLTTNFTAVAATLNNIGPGLSLVGPMRNFALFSNVSKYVLMFDMLAGRLELFPLLLLFHPAIWKDMLTPRHTKRMK